MNMKLLFQVFLLFAGITFNLYGQPAGKCTAFIRNDTMVIKNNVVWQYFKWTDGNLVRIGFGRVDPWRSFIQPDTKPGLTIGQVSPGGKGKIRFELKRMSATEVMEEHLEFDVYSSLGELEVKRVFTVFPDCPAIRCDIFLKGKFAGTSQKNINQADLKNIESESARLQNESSLASSDIIKLDGPHWQARAVEFFDITDRNNTLVQEYDRLAYRQETQLRGNLLLLTNTVNGDRLFLLKEAPVSSVQLNYPGYDFTVKQGEARVLGLGISPSDLNDSVWTQAYGTVTGLSLTNDELGILTSLRQYQMKCRIHKPGRDDMILMNTWGDRNQDKRVNEAFALAELEAGSRLGITHFQLDDGWQTGRSSNSAFKGGSLDNIWRNPDYWKPDPVKFPNGLAPVVKKGKDLGIEVCVWFNPSPDNGNINWEKDATALIELYKKYGIRTFKIDGVKLPDKLSEINFRKMLDMVVKETGGNAVFNLDVTAGRRGGYNYFNEYGNLFLENRYTDWKNYYPFWTLRNLWMLSKYIPAQNLQIEYLNIWRNQANYASDPFGPVNYSFDYVFAITMMAQPLAWFEATGLPSEAFKTAGIIKKYRSIQSDIHSGTILPIGQEPDGNSWTGFQSLKGNDGYLLIFRERSGEKTSAVKTWFKEGDKVSLTTVLGQGKSFPAKAGKNGVIVFSLDKPDSFVLYKYSRKQ
jgi:alpha-galactosidase